MTSMKRTAMPSPRFVVSSTSADPRMLFSERISRPSWPST